MTAEVIPIRKEQRLVRVLRIEIARRSQGRMGQASATEGRQEREVVRTAGLLVSDVGEGGAHRGPHDDRASRDPARPIRNAGRRTEVSAAAWCEAHCPEQSAVGARARCEAFAWGCWERRARTRRRKPSQTERGESQPLQKRTENQRLKADCANLAAKLAKYEKAKENR